MEIHSLIFALYNLDTSSENNFKAMMQIMVVILLMRDRLLDE